MVFAQRTLHLLGMSKESALILEDRWLTIPDNTSTFRVENTLNFEVRLPNRRGVIGTGTIGRPFNGPISFAIYAQVF